MKAKRPSDLFEGATAPASQEYSTIVANGNA
jgi:hypothetical protein